MNEPIQGANPPTPSRKKIAPALLIVVGALLLAFIGIQFIPVNRTNPPVASQIQWDSAQTEALATRACMDCHSNETVWPWYAYIAPASWLVYYDVERGRSELNFSTMNASAGFAPGQRDAHSNDLAYQLGQLLAGEGERGEGPENFRREGGDPPPREEFSEGEFPQGGFGGRFTDRIAEAIQEKQMPPTKYTIIHWNASLTDAERLALIKGLDATFGVATQ